MERFVSDKKSIPVVATDAVSKDGPAGNDGHLVDAFMQQRGTARLLNADSQPQVGAIATVGLGAGVLSSALGLQVSGTAPGWHEFTKIGNLSIGSDSAAKPASLSRAVWNVAGVEGAEYIAYNSLKENHPTLAQLIKPTPLEAGLIAGASGVGGFNSKQRILMVAGAWIVGRAENAAEMAVRSWQGDK